MIELTTYNGNAWVSLMIPKHIISHLYGNLLILVQDGQSWNYTIDNQSKEKVIEVLKNG